MRSKISIIMPVYNCEDYIEESIRSIQEQTYLNWELIIINDGSTDRTEEKILDFKQKYRDERINYKQMNKHKGLVSAFNEGYKLATGDFIIRHDGDDKSSPKRLEIQAAYLEKNPEVSMVSCLISCFTKEPLFRKDCIFIERIQNYYITNEEINKAVLGGFIPVLFPTLMIRKSLLDKADIDNYNPSFNDHTELLLQLIKIGQIEKINTILYYYRRHPKAVHIIKQKEYQNYTIKLLKDPIVKNHLQYKDFYKDLSSYTRNKSKLNENSTLRVLMMVDALNIGGTETHILNIVKKMIDMGIYVVVATAGGPMEGLMQSYGIKIIKVPIDNDYISNKKKFGLLSLIKTIIDEEKINVIHCHLFASMQLASELYRLYKTPYVVTIHGLFYPNDVLYSSCLQASKIIAVSEPVKKMLITKLGNKVKDKISVISNGINIDLLRNLESHNDLRRALNIPSSAKVLCYCSRLDWNKTEAARVFLFSFAQLITEISNLHTIILGDGTGKETILKEAEIINEMANRKVVHVVGAKVNVIPYYMQSTVVIGTARVALEAMMCKKPVIALGNQGYSGIINEKTKNRQWEMYFGDHDALQSPTVSTLVMDIKSLLRSSDRRRKLGEWGKKWCERYFNNDELVKEIVNIYKEIIE